MKHLVIYSHPNPKSFCSAIRHTVVEYLMQRGEEVVVRDLYAEGFNPILTVQDLRDIEEGALSPDIVAEQSHIIRSDVMIFIYPIWRAGPPAMAKGYMDRVFSNGFAYDIKEDAITWLLPGKKVVIFNTMGASLELYEGMGMLDALSRTSDAGIFEFSGVQVLAHKFFGAVPFVDDAARKAMLEEVKATLDRVLPPPDEVYLSP